MQKKAPASNFEKSGVGAGRTSTDKVGEGGTVSFLNGYLKSIPKYPECKCVKNTCAPKYYLLREKYIWCMISVVRKSKSQKHPTGVWVLEGSNDGPTVQ